MAHSETAYAASSTGSSDKSGAPSSQKALESVEANLPPTSDYDADLLRARHKNSDELLLPRSLRQNKSCAEQEGPFCSRGLVFAQISIWPPSSTTRFGGMRKNSVASRVLFDITMKSVSRQRHNPAAGRGAAAAIFPAR